MKTEQEKEVTVAFEKWYVELCTNIPLAAYENKDLLFTAFIAGAVYIVEDTNKQLSSLLRSLNGPPY